MGNENFLIKNASIIDSRGTSTGDILIKDGKISKVGKIEVINPTSAGDQRGAGFWCETCSCLLKDSAGYLDHINGKKRKFIYSFYFRCLLC